MLIFSKVKHGINFSSVWFAEQKPNLKGIVMYYEANFTNSKNDIAFDTLITDLDKTEEEIKQQFSKSCKYKINRAPRENVSVTIKKEDISDSDILEFIEFFTAFWQSKGNVFDNKEGMFNELKKYRAQDALTIAYATIRGGKVVYHTHIYDNKVARLLHSASLFRLIDEDTDNAKNVIGMANRYLHFEEIKYFKQLGLTRYDWGGAGKSEEVKHITEFKESFGGEPVTYYNFEDAVGLKAHLFKFLVKILRK